MSATDRGSISSAVRTACRAVFDCGSRDARGGLELARRLRARELHIFSYDPVAVARCCGTLSRAGNIPKIYLNPFAVTESDGYLDFVPGPPAVLGPAGKRTACSRSIRVRSVTLDAYCALHGVPDILRIASPEDAVRTLRGAEGVLPSIGVVLLPAVSPPGGDGGAFLLSARRALRDRFEPLSAGDGAVLPEADIAYVNRGIVSRPVSAM